MQYQDHVKLHRHLDEAERILRAEEVRIMRELKTVRIEIAWAMHEAMPSN
jgi:hypothetical protein